MMGDSRSEAVKIMMAYEPAIIAITAELRHYRQTHVRAPDKIIVPPGFLPDDTDQVLGMTVERSPALPEGVFLLAVQADMDDDARMCEALGSGDDE